LESVKEKLGDQFTDPRLESFSGTKLSAKACMEISKNLGLNYIPALLKPSIKAVIVDLDNTLYDGVLGEDGIEGITLTDSHKRLQQKLKELANKGFFLCIASKNNESDVLSLFNQRIDFPLKINDFTKICASWDDKTDSIYKISRFLNIGTESMLFIDDNIGELFNANEAYPNLHTIWARDDANITLKVLSNYPGLLKLKQHKEDSIRRQDVIANQERNKLRDSMSKEEYIKTLGIELTFHIDNIEQATRVAELANKTNQFIFSYKRYGQEAIKSLMMAKESMVITVSLKDKLSDSGIIGTCVFIHHDDYIELEECFVSCRALGRGIDEIIVLGAIVQAQNFFGDKKLKVNFIKGERNLPAETFVLSFLSNNVSQENYFSYTIPKELFSIKVVKEKF
jgi:FkbH-like protein